MVTYPLHKGADGWMSQKQFDTFYWPSLKKVMDAFIKEGLIQNMFAEGGYNTRLETVNEFPKGSVCWYFDKTDMAKAKTDPGEQVRDPGQCALVAAGDRHSCGHEGVLPQADRGLRQRRRLYPVGGRALRTIRSWKICAPCSQPSKNTASIGNNNSPAVQQCTAISTAFCIADFIG